MTPVTISDALRGNVVGSDANDTIALPIVTPPSGFTLVPPFTILRFPFGFVPQSWDISDLEPTTTATMYISPAGDDGNDGSTLVLAKRSIENAISSMTQATKILLADGEYVENYDTGYGGHWRNSNPAYSCSIKAINSGHVIQSPRVCPTRLTWTVYAGATYQATYASDVQSIFDSKVLVNTDYVKLALQSSIANVEANAGSWYQAAGVVYLHLSDGRSPDTDVYVYRDIQSAYCARDGITIYLEGIEFQGGPNGAGYFRNGSAAGGLRVYAKNCKFKYSFATGGFACEGTTLSICQGCEGAANDNDGFNYHVWNGVIPDAIEIDCIGRNNGTTSDVDNNGSSMHDAGRVLRINGEYHDTYGPVIIDANQSLSWNLGVESYQSLSPGEANFDIDGTMWLDTCNSHDHNPTGYDLHVQATGDALYYHNLTSDGDFLNNAGGTLAEY